MKNLVISTVGESSLHRNWCFGGNFDVFLVYYGDRENRYKNDAKFYIEQKGTKYQIIYSLLENYENVLKEYDNFFLPDDDLYFTKNDLDLFFQIFTQYKLCLAQPSILGYFSTPFVLNRPNSFLRYVNWVEMMCPCFSKKTLFKCKDTFLVNKTGWGMEYLWNELLLRPKNKIAIIDGIIGIHTRPCLMGDNYHINNFYHEQCIEELRAIQKKLTNYKIKTYRMIYTGEKYKDFSFEGFSKSTLIQERIYPNDQEFINKLENIKNRILFT